MKNNSLLLRLLRLARSSPFDRLKRRVIVEQQRQEMAKGPMTPAERRRFRREWLAVAEQDERERTEAADRLI